MYNDDSYVRSILEALQAVNTFEEFRAIIYQDIKNDAVWNNLCSLWYHTHPGWDDSAFWSAIDNADNARRSWYYGSMEGQNEAHYLKLSKHYFTKYCTDKITYQGTKIAGINLDV